MSFASADPLFKIIRITAVLQHFLIIICFKKGSMTLLELVDQVLAGHANICKNTHFYFAAMNRKAKGIGGIVVLRKGNDRKFPNGDPFVFPEMPDQVFVQE